MIVCEEGTECSRLSGSSVLAFGFIDQQSVWMRSEAPCLSAQVLRLHFGYFDESDLFYGGDAVFKHSGYSYAPWRGPNSCRLCERIVGDDGMLVVGRKAWTGIVVIPSVKIPKQHYLFPVGLGHMIEVHYYQPPNDLIDALVNFEFDPDWDTKSLEHKLFHAPRSIR